MSDYLALTDLAHLGGRGVVFNGAHENEFSGLSVAFAGDVNGDGYDDLLVSCSTIPDAVDEPGKAFIIYGHAGSWANSFNLYSVNGANGFLFNGETDGQEFGSSVSSAGDVNGDGIADIIVGAYNHHNEGQTGPGAAYVLFGSATGFDAQVNAADLDGSNGFRLNGAQAEDGVGLSVASVGDLNGDGFHDIAVGSWQRYDNGLNVPAETYIVFGKADGWDASIDLDSLGAGEGAGIRIAPGDTTALEVASAGDFNGDGIADMIMGALSAEPSGRSDQGAAYVIFGHDGPWEPTLDVSTLDGSNGFAINGLHKGDVLGWRAQTAGDLNGDGITDIAVSAPGAGSGYGGEAYVIFGSTDGFPATLDVTHLNGRNGFVIHGLDEQFSQIYTVASAGDWNGDGLDDLVVGVPWAQGDSALAGRTFILFGGAKGWDADFQLSDINGDNGVSFEGIGPEDFIGVSVAGAGDLNGDGLADIAFGGPNSYRHVQNVGESYVIFGALPGQAVHRVGNALAQTIHGGEFDDVLNGRAGDDVLIGHGGDDTLRGAKGGDQLFGGDGADTFVFETFQKSTVAHADHIGDLSADDVIDLSAIDAVRGEPGDQAFVLVSQFTGAAGQLTWSYAAGSDTSTLKGDIDGDGQADFVVQATGDHTGFTNFVL